MAKVYPTGEDTNWRIHVDERLDGVEKTLAQNTADTATTLFLAQSIEAKLAQHQDRTKPVIDAIENMQAGVRFLGKLGDGWTWCAHKARFWAPTIAAAVAIYVALKGEWVDLWHWLTFWKR